MIEKGLVEHDTKSHCSNDISSDNSDKSHGCIPSLALSLLEALAIVSQSVKRMPIMAVLEH